MKRAGKVVNGTDATIIAYRQELVARARLRGASMREIVAGLVAIGFVNPQTNEPWSLTTIHADLKAVQSEWRREAKQTIAKHKSRQMAELAEVRRQAWHDNDMASVLRAISLEMTLLGTEAPKVTNVGNAEVEMQQYSDASELLRSRIDSLAAKLRASVVVGASGAEPSGEGSA